MAIYLDASVVVAMLVVEATSSAVLRLLATAEEPLLVSEFTAAEVAAAVSRAVRTGRLTMEMGLSALADFDAWRSADADSIPIDDLDLAQASLLVRRFELKLRAPDALHLAICLRSGARLATSDSGLAEAARACGANVAAFA